MSIQNDVGALYRLLQYYNYMSFVFGKAPKSNIFQNTTKIPGPGQYENAFQRNTQYAAPFNSSSFKQSIFDVNTSITGPGSYDPVYSKDIHSNNKPTINSSFKSRVERFKTQPSPQRYENYQINVSLLSQKERIKQTSHAQSKKQKQKYNEAINRTKHMMNDIKSINNKRKIDSISTNKEFVRIILSNPKNTEFRHSVYVDKSITKRESGPGSYEIMDDGQSGKMKSRSVVDWSKNKVKRFKTEKNRNPGPGEYTFDLMRRRSINLQKTAAFASKVMRSHMDQIIYKTRIPFKAQVMEEKKVKDKYPGPGEYNPQLVTSKSFHYGQANFGSINENYQKQNEQIPGPGYYNYDQTKTKMKQQLKKIRDKIFGKKHKYPQKEQTLQSKNKQELVKQFIKQMQNQKNKYYSLEQRCTSKAGNFSLQERFKEKDIFRRTEFPGPGEYKVNGNGSQDNVSRYNHGFNSSESRKFVEQKNPTNLPFYDVDKNDIGKKALKIRKTIQNLRQIDIQKAPFNSRQKRQSLSSIQNKEKGFQHEKMALNELDKKNARYLTESSLKLQPVQQQKKQTSVFKSKTKREVITSTQTIGPGYYGLVNNFEKKSFNTEYDYRPPGKVRPNYLTKSSLK